MEKEEAKTHKVILLGEMGVGKTSIIERYTRNAFTVDQQITLQISFKTKDVKPKGCPKHIKLAIWDTAGHERFRSVVKMYYRGSEAVVICFDVTNRETLNSA